MSERSKHGSYAKLCMHLYNLTHIYNNDIYIYSIITLVPACYNSIPVKPAHVYACILLYMHVRELSLRWGRQCNAVQGHVMECNVNAT